MSELRTIHLVGSYPASSAEQALSDMFEAARACPRPPLCLPDGETSRSALYIAPILDELVTQQILEFARRGDWTNLRNRTRYRPGPRFGAEMRLGYAGEAMSSLAVLRALRTHHGMPNLALQVGAPTPASIALVALGGRGALARWRRSFVDATMAEIKRIHEGCGPEAAVQLEATAELIAVAALERAGGPYRPLARRAGASIAAIAAQAPQGTRLGVHLCMGDLANRAALRPRSLASAVCLANAVVDHWPTGRPLDYIHLPAAAGTHSPPPERRFYAALSQLRCPPGTQLHLGIAHERQSLSEQRTILQTAENALGRPVNGVSTACGLGRRSPEVARALLTRMVELAQTP